MHQREESVGRLAVTCPKGPGDARAMSMSKTVASLPKSSAERVDESCNSLSEPESSSSGGEVDDAVPCSPRPGRGNILSF